MSFMLEDILIDERGVRKFVFLRVIFDVLKGFVIV